MSTISDRPTTPGPVPSPDTTATLPGDTDHRLLPRKTRFTPEEPVVVEVRNHGGAGTVTLYRLGDPVVEIDIDGSGDVDLGRRPGGGYGVELAVDGAMAARTAVDVSADPGSRLRYGFVADHAPGRDLAPVLENVRRLHLTGIQFYDWAYRHADLLGGGPAYTDALGQTVSLETVSRLTHELGQLGTDAYGYAAVYAVGPDQWPSWAHAGLVKPDGGRYALEDFLFLVDPAHPDWLRHMTRMLADAAAAVGFTGFHLDQYGYPRRARRVDGAVIDLANSFDTFITAARDAVPGGRLVFNNVNDFPTWRTGHSAQDAVYVELWQPHDTLGALARVVDRARASAGGKPVVVAAYQHVYDQAPAEQADLAARFTMATLFSHGATHLLAGEGDRVLVDPYYVRNHTAAPATLDMLARWYDFLVEHDAVLMPAAVVDVTGSWVGEYNADLDVTFAASAVTEEPQAGAVWRRVTEVDGRLVVHLVNLVDQEDTLWDVARRPPGHVGTSVLRVRPVQGCLPRVRVADPDRAPRLVDVPVQLNGDFAYATLPEPYVWQMVLVDLECCPPSCRTQELEPGGQP